MTLLSDCTVDNALLEQAIADTGGQALLFRAGERLYGTHTDRHPERVIGVFVPVHPAGERLCISLDRDVRHSGGESVTLYSLIDFALEVQRDIDLAMLVRFGEPLNSARRAAQAGLALASPASEAAIWGLFEGIAEHLCTRRLMHLALGSLMRLADEQRAQPDPLRLARGLRLADVILCALATGMLPDYRAHPNAETARLVAGGQLRAPADLLDSMVADAASEYRRLGHRLLPDVALSRAIDTFFASGQHG